MFVERFVEQSGFVNFKGSLCW